jgi:hypothetical protein
MTALFAVLFLVPNDALCSGKNTGTIFEQGRSVSTVSQKDLTALPHDTTVKHLRLAFGEPFGTTVPRLLTWPKKRTDIDLLHDSEETIWRNGYWFFISQSSPYNLSRLLLVASHNTRSDKITPILDQWRTMTIDWPGEWQGKTVGQYFESGGILPLAAAQRALLQQHRKKLLESPDALDNRIFSFQQSGLRLQVIDADLESDLFIATDMQSGEIVYGEILELAAERNPVTFLPGDSPDSAALLSLHVGGSLGTGLSHTEIKVYLVREGRVKKGYEGDLQGADFSTCAYSSEYQYLHSFTPNGKGKWRMHITGSSTYRSCPKGISCEECTEKDINEEIKVVDETHLLETWPKINTP